MDIRALAEKYEGYIIEQRRWFHAHPELSWEEFGTTDHIQEELEKKEYHTSWNFAAGQLEDMCRYFTEKMKVRTVILRLPYLADRINEHNFLGEVFRCMYEQERVMLPYHRDDPVDFLTMRDLADLL